MADRMGSAAAFTLAELAMCIAVTGLIFAGVIAAHLQSPDRAKQVRHLPAASEIASMPLLSFPQTTSAIP